MVRFKSHIVTRDERHHFAVTCIVHLLVEVTHSLRNHQIPFKRRIHSPQRQSERCCEYPGWHSQEQEEYPITRPQWEKEVQVRRSSDLVLRATTRKETLSGLDRKPEFQHCRREDDNTRRKKNPTSDFSGIKWGLRKGTYIILSCIPL